jgi:CubicO group peptidase (beta-lactamase class C family)
VLDALLLAEMVERGEVRTSDRIDEFVPPDLVTAFDGQPITILHLVTHTSGLPGRRTFFAAEECQADLESFREFFAAYTPARAPGSSYEYSNIGAQLLRHALAVRGGIEYEQLLRARVTGPLGMDSTTIAARTDIASRTATGHDDRLRPVATNPASLRSTAHDLCILLRACLGLSHHEFGPAFARMRSIRIPIGAGVEVALGWNIETSGGDDVVCHDGLSAGFRSWIGFRPSVRRGAVVLSNAAARVGVQDLGYHLLDSGYPLMPADAPLLEPTLAPAVVTLDEATLEAHVGRYQLTPNVFITITRNGRRLFAQRTERPLLEITPESALVFFCDVVEFWELPADTRIIFKRDEHNATVGITLRQRGRDVWLPRVDAHQPSKVWFGRMPATVDPNTLSRYVGQYRLRSAILTVRRERDRLVGRFDDAPETSLVPSGQGTFFIANDLSDVALAFDSESPEHAQGVVATYDALTDHGVRIP